MFSNLKVGSRLYILTTFASVITVVVMLFGIFSMKHIAAGTEVMYKERAVALVQLGIVDASLIALGGDFFRAFQHNPQFEVNQVHSDHALEVHLTQAEGRMKAIEAAWALYMATPLSDEEKTLAAQFTKEYAQYVNETIRPALASLRANDFSNEVIAKFIRGSRGLGAALEKTSLDLISVNDKLSELNFEDATQTYHSSLTYMLMIFAIGLLLSIFIAWNIIHSIVAPLTGLQERIGEVEQSGDFTQRVPVSGANEIGQTATSFNQLLGSMQKALKGIFQDTDLLDKAAVELTATAEQAAQSSQMTSETSAAMAASVEEMTVSINHVAQSSQETFQITQRTSKLSEQGGDVIRQTIGKMHVMAEAVRKSAENIDELSQQSESISGIVQVIKDVADQTNLLALNAAIEAARAGEQGRGFAVVADEVRKLAERTSKATGEISTMISAIQESSQLAVSVMAGAAEQVESGVALADQAGTAITDIQEGSAEVQTCVNDATSALSEQSIASQSIAQQVERVAQASEQNSTAAKDVSEAAANIEHLARSMRDTVSKFKF
ncbi:MAG: methyl-accepting chemotaxis protein [Betaproteobacteria bacterium]|nr:methyl-accepting chemotaxis protein [Betaproteobacteria bacterium]MCL2885639.1 methyl-accepting chemotaxis protein [Betaproteobacteria bacterium]